MKNCIWIILLFSAFTLQAQTRTIKVSWTFLGIVPGYDHSNKMEVTVDGKLIGESPEFKQTDKGSFTFTIDKGKHQFKVVNYAYYEGKWELHNKSNDYSIDAFFEGEYAVVKDAELKLTFDIDSASTSAIWQDFNPAAKPKKMAELAVNWTYYGVVEGYDHPARIAVYVDGSFIGYSSITKESEGGKANFQIPKGTHEIRVAMSVYYENHWEEQTKANNYSLDSFVVEKRKFKKKSGLTLLFDIDKETTTATWK